MARIQGVDLPRNKKMQYALTALYGVGYTTAKEILTAAGIDWDLNSNDLTDDHAARIRTTIEKNGFKVEGDLRRNVAQNIKRLVDLRTYRGIRHRKKLPVHGQRTRCNARTRKGKAVAIAGKKSIKSMK